MPTFKNQAEADKYLATMKEITELEDYQSKTPEEKLKIQTERLKKEQDLAKAAAERYEYETRLNEVLGNTMASWQANIGFLEEYEKLLKSGLGHDEIEVKMGLTQGRLEQMVVGAQKAKEKLQELGAAGTDALEEFEPIFEDIATKMGLFSPAADKMIKKMKKLGFFANDEKGIKGIQMALKKVFSPTNIAIGLFTKLASITFEAAMATDKATSEFAKQTGMGRVYTGVIDDIGNSHRNLGLQAEDAGKALAALTNKFPMLQNQSQEVQRELAFTVAGLEKLGVSMDDSSESITFFSQNLGLAGPAAAEATKELALLGKGLGKTAGQITKDFNAAMKTLAVYGDKAPEVFEGIAAMAATAAVEMNTLMGITSKFQEFGSAASTAAKLNAVFGTKVSGVNIMLLDEKEQIEAIIRAFQSTGKTFSTMNKFQQRLIANTVGIQDLNEAQRIFSMNIHGYRAHLAEAQKTARANEEMEKRMKEAMKVADKIKQAFMNLAIQLGPLVDTIAYMIQLFADFMSLGGGLVGKIVLISGAFFAFAKYTPLIAALGTAIFGLASSFGPVSKGGALAGKALSAFGKGASAGLGFLANPAALIGIGALVALFAGFAIAATAASKVAIATSEAAGSIVEMGIVMKDLVMLDFDKSFGSLGPALRKAQKEINDISKSGAKVKITSVLENLALITTGQSAEAGMASSSSDLGISKLTEELKISFKEMLKGTPVTLQLDGPQTEEFWRKKHVQAQLD